MKKTIVILSLVLFANHANAEMSYGSKFLATTLAACAVGGAGSYIYASNTGYDSQPRTIVTFMGATTGCISGALFSYLFYEDKTDKLTAQVSSDEKTITDLKIQLARMKNSSLYSFSSDMTGMEEYLPKTVLPELSGQNPFENLGITEVITQKMIDDKNLPSGFSSETCAKWYNFYLTGDSTISTTKKEKLEFIAIDKNYALIGFQFAYSYDGCFKPSSSQNGKYFGNYWPSLTNFLHDRVAGLKRKVAKQKLESATAQAD